MYLLKTENACRERLATNTIKEQKKTITTTEKGKTEFLHSFVGHGIKCYQCDSQKSWADCVYKNDTTCPSDSEACVKAHIEAENSGTTINNFVKNCAKISDCKDGCKFVEGLGYDVKTCDVHCCDSDLCNGAKVPMVSGFLFLACPVAVFSFR